MVQTPAPMSAKSRLLRSRLSGLSRSPKENAAELAYARSEFAASRLEDHIREVAPTLNVAQITRLVAALLDDGEDPGHPRGRLTPTRVTITHRTEGAPPA